MVNVFTTTEHRICNKQFQGGEMWFFASDFIYANTHIHAKHTLSLTNKYIYEYLISHKMHFILIIHSFRHIDMLTLSEFKTHYKFIYFLNIISLIFARFHFILFRVRPLLRAWRMPFDTERKTSCFFHICLQHLRGWLVQRSLSQHIAMQIDRLHIALWQRK